MEENKNKGGRPSIYNNDIVEKAKSYIAYFMTTPQQDLENEMEVMPSIAGLALFLGIHRSTIYDWAEKNSEFSDIISHLMDAQELILSNNGLKGKFNPQIAKLMLTKHGYSDKVSQDHTSSDGSMAQPTRIELVAKINDDS